MHDRELRDLHAPAGEDINAIINRIMIDTGYKEVEFYTLHVGGPRPFIVFAGRWTPNVVG